MSHNSARKSTDKKLEKRNKRNRSLSIEDNAYSPPYKMHRNNSSCESSPNRSIVGEEDRDERPTKLDEKHTHTFPEDEMDDKERRISELRNKNQQCLDYIRRTERLLALIRSEQDRISDELESIINRSNRQPTVNAVEENATRKKFAKVAEKLYPSPSPNDSFSDTSESSDSDEYDGYEFKTQEKMYVPPQFPIRSLMTHEPMPNTIPNANISNLISV